MTTIFKKILDKEIPAKIIYEDDLCLAFHDVNPQAPVHILVIPKTTEMDRLSSATEKHQNLLGYLLLKAAEIAKKEKLSDYRIVFNNGEGAGQTVFHLHLHILGGRPMAWPPG
jgi:histidine triad (HIT) family protein